MQCVTLKQLRDRAKTIDDSKVVPDHLQAIRNTVKAMEGDKNENQLLSVSDTIAKECQGWTANLTTEQSGPQEMKDSISESISETPID